MKIIRDWERLSYSNLQYLNYLSNQYLLKCFVLFFFNYLHKKWTSSNCQNNTIDKLNVASGIIFVYITTVINYYYSLWLKH